MSKFKPETVEKKFINNTCEKNRTNILLGDVAALNYGGGLTTGLWGGGGVGGKNKRHICVFTVVMSANRLMVNQL